MDNTDAWKARRTAEALDCLVQRQRMSNRMEALELAIAYEVQEHDKCKQALRDALARITQLESQITTLKTAPASAIACEMNGLALWCEYELTEDGADVTSVTVQPGEDISPILNVRALSILASQIDDELQEA